jgi:hypothetical protein
MAMPSDEAWRRLRRLLGGPVVRPGDEGYTVARQLQLAEFDAVQPTAVAYCRGEDDVRACLAFASVHDLHVALRSGGHHFAGWSTTDGLVIDLSAMDAVRVADDTVHLGPGVRAVDVVERLAPDDVQVMTGVCPTVCPVGFVSGGGLGWQSRTYGVASDHLVSARLVLADGTTVRCSADEEPDLFWALRGGGGGNFGVVVDLEVRRTHVPRLVGYTVIWPWSHALTVLDRWAQWVAEGPDALASEIGPVLPDASPGAEAFVMMHGGYLGGQAEFDRLLAELRLSVGVAPVSVAAAEVPYDQAMMRLYRCDELTGAQRRRVGTAPGGQLPRQGYLRERHRLLAEPLSPAVLYQALELFGADRRPGQFRYLAFEALGGAINRVAPDETAYVHRDARFMTRWTLIGEAALVGDFAPPGDEELAAAGHWVDRGFALIDPHSTGGSYVNFPDPALDDWASAYYGENYPRLQAVKHACDPKPFFTFPQSIS